MDIGDALTCFFSAFLPTMILSRIFLKEKIGIYKIFCGIITIAGLVLILKVPDTDIHGAHGVHDGTLKSINNTSPKIEEQNNDADEYANAWFGPVSAMISMFSLAIVFVISTFLYQNKSTESVDTTVLYNGLGQLLVSVIATMFGGRSRLFGPSSQETPYDTWDWICLSIISLTSIAAIFTRFLALKYIGPTTASFVRTVDIVLTYFAQIIFFHAIPNSLSILGAFFILLVCVVIPFEKTFVSFIPEKLQPFF
jgi:drug/metabolite transporter (DMT)-like permease